MTYRHYRMSPSERRFPSPRFQQVRSCSAHSSLSQNRRPPRPGVKTAGVKIPIERLKPEAVFPYEGSPDWIAVDAEGKKRRHWVEAKRRGRIQRAKRPPGKVSGFLVSTFTISLSSFREAQAPTKSTMPPGAGRAMCTLLSFFVSQERMKSPQAEMKRPRPRGIGTLRGNQACGGWWLVPVSRSQQERLP